MLIKFPDLASKRSKDNTPAGQIADRPPPHRRAHAEFLSSKGDPIFAAVDALRRAHAEFLSSDGEEQLDENWEIVEEAALNLIDVEPTSVAGAIALLSYFAECTAKDVELPGSGCCSGGLSDDDDPAVSKSGAPYSYFIARNVAQALSRL